MWVTLPNVMPGDSEAYRKAIRNVINEQSVDWWIPVSHTVTAVVDSAVKKELEVTNPSVKVLSIDSVESADMLDDKIKFLEEEPVNPQFRLHCIDLSVTGPSKISLIAI